MFHYSLFSGLQLHAHHKQAIALPFLFFGITVKAGESVSVCLKAIGSIVSFQVLLCLSVIVYVSLNCVLMYIGNDIRDM